MGEYEALVQGLKKSINMNAKCIEVFGDSQVVIKHVRNYIGCNSYHLKNYQQEVWDLMNKFEEFNIKSIPHIENSNINMLANAASNNDPSYHKFYIKLICKLSILDNNHRIFGDEQNIMDFIHS